jgi:carboxylesterase type B
VRFGATPIRFGLSSTPAEIADNSTIQDSSFGPGCYAINPKMLKIGKGESDIGSPITIPSPSDCLFLDIYVPASAFEPNAPKLPVVVWFYGGAYAFGSKQNFGPDYPEFYSGQGLMEQNDLIFVAGNYRLGAFGWLAGSYMEGKEVGVPNAGFYDQRLLLQWVRDWIDKVGGDNTKVSAWGESAGAGSILHHLVQKGGKRDPLFTKAMLQSPAFQWQWDREGTLDTVFQNFSSLSGCGFTKNITCLRTANITRLVQANHDLFLDVKNTGLFPVGPSVDKIWMDDLPAVAFSQSMYIPRSGTILELITPRCILGSAGIHNGVSCGQ